MSSSEQVTLSQPEDSKLQLALHVDPISLSTKAKRRMRTSREEIAALEDHYKKNSNPNNEEKENIANEVKMAAKSVHFWFQNRRAKDNRNKKLKKRQQELAQQQHPNLSLLRYHGPSNITNTSSVASFMPDVKSKGKAVNLPPISSIITPDYNHLSIPFYFHHSNFGIEASMLQWIIHQNETASISNNNYHY